MYAMLRIRSKVFFRQLRRVVCFRQDGHWMWSAFEKSTGIVDFVSISISFTCLVCALRIISRNARANTDHVEERRLLLTVGKNFVRCSSRLKSRFRPVSISQSKVLRNSNLPSMSKSGLRIFFRLWVIRFTPTRVIRKAEEVPNGRQLLLRRNVVEPVRQRRFFCAFRALFASHLKVRSSYDER